MSRAMRLFLLLLIVLLLGCGGSETALGGGGGTETVGTIIKQNGEPAAGAKVLFVPVEYSVPLDYAQSHSERDLQPDSLWADEKGEFLFDDIADGLYNIYYEKEKDRALRHHVQITEGKADTIITDTLASSGAIQGVVRLRPEHNAKEVYILLMGSNRFYMPKDTLGNFALEELPAGQYDVRFVASEDNYDDVDTVLTVRAGYTDTLSDTIWLPYNGLLPPTEVTVKYDEDLQETHLSWLSIESKRLKGYQIKRRENREGSEFDVIASRVLTTSYIDKMHGDTVQQGKEYIYSVQAIDKDGVPGSGTCSESVTYSSSFKLNSSTFVEVGEASKWGNIERDFNGRVWVTSNATKELFIVDEESWGSVTAIDMSSWGMPLDIECMADSTMLIATKSGVYNVDYNGDSLHFFPIKTYDIACRDARYLYYCERAADNFNAIRVVDMHGEENVKTLLEDEWRHIESITIKDNQIYIAYTQRDMVQLVSSALDHYMPQLICRKSGNSGEIDFSVNASCVRLLATHEVCTYSLKGMLCSRTKVPEGAIALTNGKEKGFTLWNRYGLLGSYRKNSITQSQTQSTLVRSTYVVD